MCLSLTATSGDCFFVFIFFADAFLQTALPKVMFIHGPFWDSLSFSLVIASSQHSFHQHSMLQWLSKNAFSTSTSGTMPSFPGCLCPQLNISKSEFCLSSNTVSVKLTPNLSTPPLKAESSKSTWVPPSPSLNLFNPCPQYGPQLNEKACTVTGTLKRTKIYRFHSSLLSLTS